MATPKKSFLQRKLTLLMMAVGSGALLVAAFTFVVDDIVMMRQSKVRDIETMANVLGHNCEASLSFDMPASATDLLASLKDHPTIEATWLFDANGQLFAEYQRKEGKNATLAPKMPDWSGHRFSSAGYLDVVHPVSEGDQFLGTIQIHASMSDLHALLWRTAGITLVVLAVALAVSALLANRLQRLISVPIVELATIAKQVGEVGDYSIQLGQEPADEIGDLYHQFNLMLQRLQMRDGELRRLTAIIEATSDMVGMSTPDAQATYVNRAGRRLLGIGDEDDITRMTIPDFHPDWATQLVLSEGVPAAIQKGIWAGETAISGADGREIPVSQALMAHKSPEGEVEYLSTIIRDISERKRTERTLRNLVEVASSKFGNEFFNSITLELAKALEADFTLVGRLQEGDCRMIRTQAFVVDGELADNFEYELAGTPCENVVGKSVCSHPAGVADQFPADLMLKEMGIESYVGVPLSDSHGAAMGVVVILSRKPLENTEFAESILQIFSTRIAGEMERMQFEREREELIDQLQSQNAELERFTYTVSHDLKSPLITVKGYLGALREDLDDGDDEGVNDDLARMSSAADKMVALLNDLLELSRVGRLVNPSESVAIGDVVREAAELVAGQINLRKVKIEISDNLPVAFADRARLLEVYQNLIDNGVKYMGDQPNARIEIGVRRNGDEDICFVRDNGIGIDPRYHKKIFGLFDQLDPHFEGTGIGLTLVKRIIETHGGRLWVESEGLGHGTTFCFTLPKESSEVVDA